jgi:hypothetical protein
MSPQGDTTNVMKQARYREASDKRSDPRRAGGRLRGASYRCRWGTAPPGTHWREGNAGQNVFLGGPLGETPGSPTVSMQLQSMAEPAKNYPAMVFNTVVHLIDREFWLEASHQTQKSSAPGMDQVTAQQYAEHLDEHLRDLHERLRDNR